MLPSATHVESVPFLLTRESSVPPPAEDDPETLPDVAKAVRARLPPRRANVVAEDLPTVIVDDSALVPRGRSGEFQTDIPTLMIDRNALIGRNGPTMIIGEDERRIAEPPRKRRGMRMVVAGVMALGVLGAGFGSMHAFDLHRLHGALPHSIASIFHR